MYNFSYILTVVARAIHNGTNKPDVMCSAT